jgi:hypothetical protein
MFSAWVQSSDLGIATKTREQKPLTPPPQGYADRLQLAEIIRCHK